MKYGYGWEKLTNAMSSLVSNSDIRTRLINIAVYDLIHITPEKDLPEDSRLKFNKLMQKFTAFDQVREEGQIAASVNLMDEVSLNECAQDILEIYKQTAEAYIKQ